MTSLIKRGTRYDVETRKLVYRDDWKTEEDKKNESNLKRMGQISLKIMNSINPDLQFTVESVEDFPHERLPTLDFEMFVADGVIFHSYFEKDMKTPLILMKNTAMCEQQKYSILSNELVRRLSNIGTGISLEEMVNVIDRFSKQMKNSGYLRKEVWEAVVSGIKGYERKKGEKETRRKRFLQKCQANPREESAQETHGEDFLV